MSMYLGLDFSTQSASAVLLDTDKGENLWEKSFPFVEYFPQYKTQNGILKGTNGEVHSPPLMWVESLELIVAQIKKSGIDISQIKAISGSGQQHGSVYLNNTWLQSLQTLDVKSGLALQLKNVFSRENSPIWMDTSTATECEEIANSIPELAESTGSTATMRFTGPQIRKFYKTNPDDYNKTETIHLVSSFMASLLIGKNAIIDYADGSGMNLMNLSTHDWDPAILNATAPNLDKKLPQCGASSEKIGTLSQYWVERFGFNPDTQVIAFSGDNPCSLIGLGLSNASQAAISLGTSDTYFGISDKLSVSAEGEGHVFASPSEGYMSLICFVNGSLAREKVREQYNLSWEKFEEAVASIKPGNKGKILLPYFDEEITPASKHAQVYRYGLHEKECAENCRAVLEAQFLSMRLHSSWMPKPESISVTGGASNNETILQIIANVFGAKVRKLKTTGGAGLGAALRAYQGFNQLEWSHVFSNFIEYDEKTITPDPLAHSLYEDLIKVYAKCEAFSIASGTDPESSRLAFISRWK